MTFDLKNLPLLLSGIHQGKSLCRILQNLECKKIKIQGKIIEFGAEPGSKNNFSLIARRQKVLKFDYSDKYINKKGVIKADLNFKTTLKKNHYNTVLFFNVLEHLINIENAKEELKKILKKNGRLIGSTPFLYRYHGAPSDYYRFTKSFYEVFYKKNFKLIKIVNLGFGPLCLCYSIVSDFTKKIPFLNPILFLISYFLDLILSKLVKYNLEDVYPIAVFFDVKKK